MKPLMKHEIKRIWGVILLILATSIGVGLRLNLEETTRFTRYIRGTVSQETQFVSILSEHYGTYLMLSLACLVVLVYFQFSEDKSSGTGDFIASLPYTQKQGYKTKLMVGIGSITLGWSVYVAGVYLIYRRAAEWIKPLQPSSAAYSYLKQEESFMRIMCSLVSLLAVMVVFYLILVVVQYALYNTLGGIGISLCGFLAIPYILLVGQEYIERWMGYEVFINQGEKILEVIGRMAFPYISKDLILVDQKGIDYEYMYYTGLHSQWVLQLITLIGVGIALVCLGKWLSEAYGLRGRKTFMVNTAIESIFIGAVTVCSALLPYGFYLIGVVGSWSLIGDSIMFVTGGIGCFIACKIIKKESV